jgi:hypothetical protein
MRITIELNGFEAITAKVIGASLMELRGIKPVEDKMAAEIMAIELGIRRALEYARVNSCLDDTGWPIICSRIDSPAPPAPDKP